MKGLRLLLLLFCITPSYAHYNFGRLLPGQMAVRESEIAIAVPNYTVTIAGQHDNNGMFHLAFGVHLVAYRIIWTDSLGNSVQLSPNTVSPLLHGAGDSVMQPAKMSLQIQNEAPRPGHYADDLTFIINPV
jgi:hypothetical protein